MQIDWRGHTIKITGNWVGRYLFLAPEYELWIDDQRLDQAGGPRASPRLEAIVEDDDGQRHHIVAQLLSLAGVRPRCVVSVEGEEIARDRVRVDNLLNPVLILFILAATCLMIYIGPDVLRHYIAR